MEIPMKLSALISALEKCSPDRPVRFENGSLPVGLESWRGSYDQLSIDSIESGKPITAGELLKMCRDSIGKTFNGYKGGDFVMNEDSLVYADPHGMSGGEAPYEVVDAGWVTIKTMHVNHY